LGPGQLIGRTKSSASCADEHRTISAAGVVRWVPHEMRTSTGGAQVVALPSCGGPGALIVRHEFGRIEPVNRPHDQRSPSELQGAVRPGGG
jgi:hypothetical protein